MGHHEELKASNNSKETLKKDTNYQYKPNNPEERKQLYSAVPSYGPPFKSLLTSSLDITLLLAVALLIIRVCRAFYHITEPEKR